MSLSELMYGPHVLVCVRVRGAFPPKKSGNTNKIGSGNEALRSVLATLIRSVLAMKLLDRFWQRIRSVWQRVDENTTKIR